MAGRRSRGGPEGPRPTAGGHRATGTAPTVRARNRSAAARARSRRRRRRRLLPLLAVLVLLAGYAYLDVRDLVPGILTQEEPWPDPEPFPTAQLPEPAEPAAAAAAPDPEAPIPTTSALSALTANLLSDSRAGPYTSVMVTDLASGEVLLDEDAERRRAPASAMKLLTAVAALEAMGPDHRLTTSVVAGGEGEIVLVGGGDITLAPDEGQSDGPLGHGGLGDLADQVSQALLAGGTEEVVLRVDDSLFTGPLLGPNWTEGEVVGGWAMPIMPLAVDLGREEDSNSRQFDPAMEAGEVFAERLQERGITVTGVDRGAAAGDGAQEGDVLLGEVDSAPMADLVEYMLHYSDNPLSEALGRMAAHAVGAETSFEGTGQAVLQILGELGIDTEGISLDDASGLSSGSEVTAKILTETVLVAADETRPHLADAIRGLPVSALEGTLEDRLNGTAAAGLLTAKTGTLPQVVSLTGLVHTVDGRVLAFTVIAGDFDRGAAYLARLAVDDWAARIADCGCS